MGQASSADLFVQVLQTMLQLRGVRVEASQLAKFLAFVKTVCPWFPSDGTINTETWKKVGDRIQGHFQAHGPDQTPVDAFALWSLIRDCLVNDSEAEKWRRLRGSLRRSQSITTLAPPADPPPPLPSLAPSSAPGPATHECVEPDLESAPLVSGDKPTPQKLPMHTLFVINFLTLDDDGRSAADRFWNPQRQAHPLVLWRDPLTGTWHGPDTALMWGRGYVCVFPTDAPAPRWLPARCVKHAPNQDRPASPSIPTPASDA